MGMSRAAIGTQAAVELPTTTVKRAAFFALIAPAESVASSFGVRNERGIVLVRMEDESGSIGWGEVWSGMPAAGALHRLNLLREFIGPVLPGLTFLHVHEAIECLRSLLLPIVRLAGERGPVEQILGGLDTAMWDLQAQRVGMPLWRVLGGQRARMRCYASGLAPGTSPTRLDALRAQGFKAFKFKTAFDDTANIPRLLQQQRSLHRGETMMLDANCGWDIATAVPALTQLGEAEFAWIEEPLGPERPAAEWMALREATKLPVAAGENLMDRLAFTEALCWLDVVQPDVAKWGGVSGVLSVGRQAASAGRKFCPHSFGTHVAAIASAHVLAAVGGAGFLELDVNQNPLRADAELVERITDGDFTLTDNPGLGLSMDLEVIERFCRASHSTK